MTTLITAAKETTVTAISNWFFLKLDFTFILFGR